VKSIQTAVRVHDRILIEVDPSIVKTAGVKNGELFEQVLTEQGILLKRVDAEENEKDVGPTPGRTSPTPARQTGGAKV
jgi:hypothetical protein